MLASRRHLASPANGGLSTSPTTFASTGSDLYFYPLTAPALDPAYIFIPCPRLQHQTGVVSLRSSKAYLDGF